jgi:SAM-dependent methyltransferase
VRPDLYQAMSRVESTHWWWTARRGIVDAMITGMRLPPDAHILEGGCGTGGNLTMLSRHGTVHAFEPNADACALALKHAKDVRRGSFPSDVPFPDGSMHLVALLDVLEHVDDDLQSLLRIRRCLRSDGHLLMTVPAYPRLWSSHDVLLHHRRRYTLTSAISKVKDAGFAIRYASYCNSILLPIAVVQRLGASIMDRSLHPAAMPRSRVNALLRRIFAAECKFHSQARSRLPFGLSIILWARRGQTQVVDTI